jgi:hypothetical protein
VAELRPLHEWSGPPGTLVSWLPTPDTIAAVRSASPSTVPPSHEQEQHLRAYRACEAQQAEMARLMIFTWQEPGVCDMRTMTHAINAHVRAHDVYHSWFDECDGVITRRVVANPASLTLAAVPLGMTTASDWQAHVTSTPSPFAWGCFRFGVVQHAGSFTCFASIDHVCLDGSLIAMLCDHMQREYRAVLDGAAPSRALIRASYLDYCAAQRQRTAALTLSDPVVAAWLDVLHANGGRLPRSPLPLGEVPVRSLAEHVHVQLLDAAAADRFDAVCVATGVRGIGGVLACAALAEHALLGTHRYDVITPTTTRKTADHFTMSGWCVGVVPISLDLTGASFHDLALAAQRCFDARRPLADVPIERVFELARDVPTIDHGGAGGVMVSYMDTSLPPFTPQIGRTWDAVEGRVFINAGLAGQVALWVVRTPRGLHVTAAYPATNTARAAIATYLETFRHACRSAA